MLTAFRFLSKGCFSLFLFKFETMFQIFLIFLFFYEYKDKGEKLCLKK